MTINSFLAKTQHHCNRCHQDSFTEDLIYDCVFAGSSEEPAEWEARCPHCNSVDVEEISAIWCRTCGDIQVPHEGERCGECVAMAREYLAEKELDDSLIIDDTEAPF